MVQKIFQFFQREINGVHSAAYLLGFFAFLSQLLALVRDRMLAGNFGPSEFLDLYYSAFRIPDFIFAHFTRFFEMLRSRFIRLIHNFN